MTTEERGCSNDLVAATLEAVKTMIIVIVSIQVAPLSQGRPGWKLFLLFVAMLGVLATTFTQKSILEDD
jgi:hypothetical protein